MARYQLWLTDDRGNQLELLDPTEFEFSRVIGGYGYITCKHPFDYSLFNAVQRDYQIRVFRAPRGGKLELYNAYFVRGKGASDFENNTKEMVFRGPDVREILHRRIIAYAVDSSQALKTTTEADDMMKAVVRENLGSSATTGRDITGLNFSVEANQKLGPQITMAFAWKNLLTTLQKIQQSSAISGDETYFDIDVSVDESQNGALSLRFVTQLGYIGRDLRQSSGDHIGFSKELGNLSEVHYEEDYMGEANYIYAGGQGSAASRTIVEVSDDDRINSSIYNRRELFANASGASTTAGVTGIANSRLNDKRPRSKLHATILDTPETPFQKLWDAGDYVSVKAFGRTFDEVIKTVTVKVDANGLERINGRFESGALMGSVVEKFYTEHKDLAARVEALETEDKV